MQDGSKLDKNLITKALKGKCSNIKIVTHVLISSTSSAVLPLASALALAGVSEKRRMPRGPAASRDSVVTASEFRLGTKTVFARKTQGTDGNMKSYVFICHQNGEQTSDPGSRLHRKWITGTNWITFFSKCRKCQHISSIWGTQPSLKACHCSSCLRKCSSSVPD